MLYFKVGLLKHSENLRYFTISSIKNVCFLKYIYGFFKTKLYKKKSNFLISATYSHI